MIGSAFISNQGDDIDTISTTTRLIWRDCPLGRWMPSTGSFTGDILPGGCRNLCIPGSFGNESDLTEGTCSGPCPMGHFCEPGTSQPAPCEPGTRNPALGAASNGSCIPCAPGAHQPDSGMRDCIACEAGTYSTLIGQEACVPCPRGGFCRGEGAATVGVWQPCPAGHYNPHRGSHSNDSCIRCPLGTSSTAPGATSSTNCEPCQAGTFAIHPDGECIPCPHRLSSAASSAACDICLEGFYLKDSRAASSDIFAAPAEHCKPCPPNAVCPRNTTLASLVVPPGHWRASPLSAVLTECSAFGGNRSPQERCSGGTHWAGAGAGYCAPGFAGPECQLCVARNHHLVDGARCEACQDDAEMAGRVVAVGLSLCIACGFLAWAYSKQSWGGRLPGGGRCERRGQRGCGGGRLLPGGGRCGRCGRGGGRGRWC